MSSNDYMYCAIPNLHMLPYFVFFKIIYSCSLVTFYVLQSLQLLYFHPYHSLFNLLCNSQSVILLIDVLLCFTM